MRLIGLRAATEEKAREVAAEVKVIAIRPEAGG